MPPINNFERTCLALAISSTLVPAQAVTITVDNMTDEVNGDTTSFFDLIIDNGGDGISLREAIEVANNDPGPDEIDFDPVVFAAPSIITLSNGALPLIDTEISINGSGRNMLTIDANNQSRVFYLQTASASLSLSSITLVNGSAFASGGAIYSVSASLNLSDVAISQGSASNYGGAISARYSSVNIVDSELSDNQTTGRGGAIYSYQGSMTITGSTLNQNTSSNPNLPTGDDVGGGAVFNLGDAATLTISDSTLSENSTSNTGAAVHNAFGGSATISNSTLSTNSAENQGGAIYNAVDTLLTTSATVRGSLQIEDSELTGNYAQYGGGGIFNSGSSTITNNTFSANSATNRGGAIYNTYNATLNRSTLSGNSAFSGGGVYSTGSSTIINSTVSGNSASGGGGVFNNGIGEIINSTISANSASFRGGGVYQRFFSLSLLNSIIAGNTADDAGSEIRNLSSITSQNNLLGDASKSAASAFSDFTPDLSDLVVTSGEGNISLNQIISPLADNGGFTQTHALVNDSPALDAGDNAQCPSNDQRDEDRKRTSNDQCDIGAFEAQDDSSFFVVPTKNGKAVIFDL